MSHQRLDYILLTFLRSNQGGIAWKESPRGTIRCFFPLYTGKAPPIYVLWNIMVEEALLSKSASVTLKHPTQFNLKSKKEKTQRCNYALWEVINQPDWFLMRMWKLNTLCFHFKIDKIAICKDLTLFIEKHFHDKLIN